MLKPAEIYARRDHARVRELGIRRRRHLCGHEKQQARRKQDGQAGPRAKEPLLLSGLLEARNDGPHLGAAWLNPLELMLEVIEEHTPASKWSGAMLEPFRQVANTNRGDIGEEFVARYLDQFEIPVIRSASRIHPWDLDIAGLKFEVKTHPRTGEGHSSSTTSGSTGAMTT